MSQSYSFFTYNNESVILVPGQKFSKDELKSRLHQMDIEASNVQKKNDLANLYDSSLQNNQNKFKIFDILRNDTKRYNSILGISQRQQMPSSINMSNNSQKRVMNISNEVKPFESNNKREQEFYNRNSINTNRQSYSDNQFSFMNTNNEQNNDTFNYGYPNNNIKRSNNQNQNYSNSRNFQNNKDSYYNNNSDNYPSLNNSNNYKNNRNNFDNNNKNINQSHYQYQEQINTNINRNNDNRYNKPNNLNNQNQNNNLINMRTPVDYQQTNESLLRRSNNNNINNNLNNSNNNYKNYNEFNSNYNQRNQRMITEIPRQTILSTGEEIQDNQINFNNYNKIESDEESEFSMFSTIRNFKNTSLYKNRKHICINVLIALLILCFAIGFLYLINSSWDSISNFFSDFFNLITDPRRLIVDGIFGFLSSLFFGAIRHFYVIIILIALIILMIYLYREYTFNKRCKEIFKKVFNELRNSGINSTISEDDIYRRYVQGFGISYEIFKKKYLPVLKKMRIDEPSLKRFTNRDNNGQNITFWQYIE